MAETFKVGANARELLRYTQRATRIVTDDISRSDARKIIQKYILCREIEGITSPRDYKTALQELVQRESGQVLKYRLVGSQGPDHAKRFFVDVDLNGEPVGSGEGHSKKEAEQMAAKAAMAKLSKPKA